MKRHDAFISHASEDKDGLVRPLADRLRRYGAHIWYDEFELKPGDSLIAKIDQGLATSEHGILIISPAFLSKPWTEYERQGLTAREMTKGEQILVPVWHDVGVDDVAEFSPTLAQRFALRTKDMSVDELALRLLEVIRADLAEGPRRRALFDQIISKAEKQLVPVDALTRPEEPIHEILPNDLERRIRVIQGSLYEVLPIPLDETIENFKRDLHPDREVKYWESIAGTYLQLVNELAVAAPAARQELFRIVGRAYSGHDFERPRNSHLSDDQLDQIRGALANEPVDQHEMPIAAASATTSEPADRPAVSGAGQSDPQAGIVRLLNESFEKMTDIRGLRAGPSELDEARALLWIGLERLCDTARVDPESCYTAIAALTPGARRLLAAQAVTELAELNWRYPRLKCPICASEDVDQEDEDFSCASCGHTWA